MGCDVASLDTFHRMKCNQNISSKDCKSRRLQYNRHKPLYCNAHKGVCSLHSWPVHNYRSNYNNLHTHWCHIIHTNENNCYSWLLSRVHKTSYIPCTWSVHILHSSLCSTHKTWSHSIDKTYLMSNLDKKIGWVEWRKKTHHETHTPLHILSRTCVPLRLEPILEPYETARLHWCGLYELHCVSGLKVFHAARFLPWLNDWSIACILQRTFILCIQYIFYKSVYCIYININIYYIMWVNVINIHFCENQCW